MIKSFPAALLTLLFASALLGVRPSHAQCTDYEGNISDLASFDITVGSDIAIAGDLGYIASALDSALVLVDLSDPQIPEELGRVDFSRGLSRVVLGTGSIAYGVATFVNETEVFVVDTSTPETPIVVSSFIEPSSLLDVDVQGDLVFVLTVDRLAIYDLANPASPQLLDTESTIDKTNAMSVQGDYVYTSGTQFGLIIFDVSTPSAIEFVSLSEDWQAIDIAVEGDFAFLPGFVNDFYVVDISDPSAPVLAKRVAQRSGTQNIVLSGSLLFGLSGLNEVVAYDVSTPEATAWIGSSEFKSRSRIASQGNLLWNASLELLDTHELDTASIFGFVDIENARSRGVFVRDDRAFVASTSGSQTVFGVYDLSTPSAPVLLGSTGWTGRPRELAVSGDIVYLTDEEGRLHVVDVSIETSPVLLNTVSIPGEVLGVSIQGSRAYVAAGSTGLHILDISAPTSPVLLGSFDTSGLAHDVVVITGEIVCVADGSAGVITVDTSDPSAPLPLDQFDSVGTVQRVTMDANHLFLADGDGGLLVLDVTESGQLSFVSATSTTNPASEVEVSGSFAYLGSDFFRAHHGVELFDVSSPSAPQAIGYVPSSGVVQDVEVHGEFILVADDDLLLLKPRCEVSAVPSPSSDEVTLRLSHPWPNPTPPSLSVMLELVAPPRSPVLARVYTPQGQLVRTLVGNDTAQQRIAIVWDGRAEDGSFVASGVYYVSVQAGNATASRSVTIVR